MREANELSRAECFAYLIDDGIGDGEAGRRGGTGCIEHVKSFGLADEVEILQQFA